MFFLMSVQYFYIYILFNYCFDFFRLFFKLKYYEERLNLYYVIQMNIVLRESNYDKDCEFRDYKYKVNMMKIK